MFFLVILPAVVAVVTFFFERLNERESFGESIVIAICGCIIAVICGAFVLLGAGAFVDYEEDDFEKTTEIVKLASFGDRFGTHGSFFLGSGSVNSTEYYYYYASLPDGGKRMGKITAIGSGAVIFEEERTDGEFEIRRWYAAGGLEFFYFKFPQENLFYKFRVPKGTVLNEFSADLK